jgi:hypothetical protein
LARIWNAAQGALSVAEVIHVAGYSLPESDTPVRLLFNSLRGRLERGEVSLVIDEPDLNARRRWEEFLPNIEARDRKWE